jgi:hypothetical protein
MTRKLFALSLILTVCALLYAQDKTSVKLNGYLIDNACASAHVSEATFKDKVKAHKTSCALMPGCVKSGYAVLTADGKLYKFDEAGNKSAEALLRESDTKAGFSVTVEGTLEGDTIHVTKVTESPAETAQ